MNKKNYDDELRKALNELDEPVKDKKSDFLNVILVVLIVLIVVVGIAGAVMIGNAYVKYESKYPAINNDPVIDNNKPDDNDNQQDNDVIIDEPDNKDHDTNNNQDIDKGLIDITNEENGDFKVLEFKISNEDNQVRFDIKSETKIAGNIFLIDNQSLSIGPISINVGTNNLYFLINGKNNYELHFNASDGREYIYEVSKEEIKSVLGE